MVLAHVGVQQVVALGPAAAGGHAPQLLAVDDHLLVGHRVQEPPAVLAQAAFDFLGADGAEEALEGVGRGGAVPAVGQQPQVPGAGEGELAHVHVVLSPADVGEQGDGEQVGQGVGAAPGDAVVGHGGEEGEKHVVVFYGFMS